MEIKMGSASIQMILNYESRKGNLRQKNHRKLSLKVTLRDFHFIDKEIPAQMGTVILGLYLRAQNYVLAELNQYPGFLISRLEILLTKDHRFLFFFFHKLFPTLGEETCKVNKTWLFSFHGIASPRYRPLRHPSQYWVSPHKMLISFDGCGRQGFM